MWAMIQQAKMIQGETKQALVAQGIRFTTSRDADTIRVYRVPTEFEKDKPAIAIAYYALECTDEELQKELVTLGLKILRHSGWRLYKSAL